MPPLMNNHSDTLSRWVTYVEMTEQAEALGVEIFRHGMFGFGFGENDELKGVVAGEFDQGRTASQPCVRTRHGITW